MQAGRRTAAATLVGVLLLLAATAPVAAADPKPSAQPPTRGACEAFADYFQIEYLVAFASAFASLGGKQQPKDAEAQIRDTFHLILSPKLQKITETLAAGTRPPARRLFVQQGKVYAKGVALLEGVGLTKDQIQKLSELDLKPETDLQQVIGDVQLDKQELNRAVKKFGATTANLDLNEATAKERAAFQAAGTACGVFPAALDCATVVTRAEAGSLLGATPKVANEDGTCTYTVAARSAGGDDAVLAVDAYKSSLAYDRLTSSAQNQAVPGVGDAAVAVDGFNAFSSIKTCGRTLITKQAEQTVVVAACTGAPLPTTDALAGVATKVLERLPAATS
jgi:hypothetical protein